MGFSRAVSHGAAVCKPKLLGKVDVATNNSGGMATYQGALETTRFGLEYSGSISNWIPTLSQKKHILSLMGPFPWHQSSISISQVYRIKILRGN